MNLEELRAERTRCSNLKSAVDSLISQLTSFTKSFGNCSAHFNAGGFLIDGKPADVYSFGGFDDYADKKIAPIINQLASLSSTLASTIVQMDAEIKRLEEEARRKAALEAEARRESNAINLKGVNDKGIYRDNKDTSNYKGAVRRSLY